MNPRLLLTQAALISRNEGRELLIASKCAIDNAEMLEEIICNGTDEEVNAALKLVTNTGLSSTSLPSTS